MMAAQAPLALGFPRRRAMGREDFIETAANAEAAALVAAWRSWPAGRLALIGPEGGGKTHLAHVFMAESGARRVRAAALRAEQAPALLASGAVAVEDADRLAEADDPPRAEAALFHLLNLAAAEGARALLTGVEPPARWRVGLPDLASRLAALTTARLRAPDDALLAAVVAKQLEDRGLRYEAALPGYLAARIERSFAAARAAVEALDAASLAERRAITRRLAAALGW
jgi:chromosomal replication initiation ATPase DnaA